MAQLVIQLACEKSYKRIGSTNQTIHWIGLWIYLDFIVALNIFPLSETDETSLKTHLISWNSVSYDLLKNSMSIAYFVLWNSAIFDENS